MPVDSKASLRARPLFQDARTTLTVVESVTLRHAALYCGASVTVMLTPIAVIVERDALTCAIDVGGNPVDVESLRRSLTQP